MQDNNADTTNQDKHPGNFSKKTVEGPIPNRAIRSAFNQFGLGFTQMIENYLIKEHSIQLNSELPVSLNNLEKALRGIIGCATPLVMDAINSELQRTS